MGLFGTGFFVAGFFDAGFFVAGFLGAGASRLLFGAVDLRGRFDEPARWSGRACFLDAGRAGFALARAGPLAMLSRYRVSPCGANYRHGRDKLAAHPDMADESQFLALLERHPDDREARSVYADWLEEQGDLRRAKLVRLHLALWQGKTRKKQREELLALGDGLPAEWLAIVNYPKINDTSWAGSNSTELHRFVLRFLPGGAFDYVQPHDNTAGSWQQVGNIILVDVNQYSKREGVIAGDEMRGSAWNIDGLEWKWTAELLPDGN